MGGGVRASRHADTSWSGAGSVAISQKVQARTLEGSTAPHCKQVLVTGEFCAADAHTPVRSVPKKINTPRDAVKILL
jgi:hypothetical protein